MPAGRGGWQSLALASTRGRFGLALIFSWDRLVHQEMHATEVKIETAEQCEFKDVFLAFLSRYLKNHKDYNATKSTVLLSEDLEKGTSKSAHIFRKLSPRRRCCFIFNSSWRKTYFWSFLTRNFSNNTITCHRSRMEIIISKTLWGCFSNSLKSLRLVTWMLPLSKKCTNQDAVSQILMRKRTQNLVNT